MSDLLLEWDARCGGGGMGGGSRAWGRSIVAAARAWCCAFTPGSLAIAVVLAAAAPHAHAQGARSSAWQQPEFDEDVAADLEWLRDHPVDIRVDPLAALESVPGVSPGFAARAENARAVLPFHRIEDLLRVPGVDAELLARLRSYVSPPSPAARTRGRIVFEAVGGGASRGTRLAERAEFARGPNLRAGGVLERDARERAIDDFSSAWIETRHGKLRLVGGALDVDWARGLALSSARAPTDVSGSLQRAFRTGRGVTPHRGTAEEGHFRGAALEAGGVRWRLTALSTDSRRDARVGRTGAVTSLAEGGLHRSTSEVATRDRLRDRMLALRGEWEAPGAMRVGATWRTNRFDPSLGPREGSSLPRGARETVSALDVAFSIGDARLTGEIAARGGGGTARLGGVRVPVGGFEFEVMARRYDPDFRVLHTAPSGAGGRSSNESGIAYGVRGRARGCAFSVAHDRWRQIARPTARDVREHGARTRVTAEAGPARCRFTAALGYTARGAADTGGSGGASDDSEDSGRARTTLRVQNELALPRGSRAVFVASGAAIAQDRAAVGADPNRSSTRGGFLQARLSGPLFARVRTTCAFTRYAGETSSAVPRLAETLLPGRTLFVPLASGALTGGSRVSLTAETPVATPLRLALGASWQAPRGAASRVEVGLALQVGRSGGL